MKMTVSSANIKINWETNICYATLKEYRLNELNWILDYRGLSLNMLNCSWRWLQKPFIISERIFNSRSIGEWFEFTKIMVSRISASKLREWEINSSLRGWTRDPKSLMERINWSINLFFWSYVLLIKHAEKLDEEARASLQREKEREKKRMMEGEDSLNAGSFSLRRRGRDDYPSTERAALSYGNALRQANFRRNKRKANI